MTKAIRKPRTHLFEHVPDDVAERVAHIIGPSGAYALALAEAKRRRAEGEAVFLFKSGATVIVGPWPEMPASDPSSA